MSYNLIQNITLTLTLAILGTYAYWLVTHYLGLPRAYNNFMELLIKHKQTMVGNNFNLSIEEDFKKRILPKFEDILLIRKELSLEDDIKIKSEYDRLNISLNMIREKAALKGKIYNFNSGKIPPYIKITKKFNIIMLTICTLFTVTYVTVKPLAYAETVEKYKAKGINNINERYNNNTKTEKQELKITDRYYESGILGGQYYNLEIEIDSPYSKKIIAEVNPGLYEEKKIGDSINAELTYRHNIDRLKEIETYEHLKLKILE